MKRTTASRLSIKLIITRRRRATVLFPIVLLITSGCETAPHRSAQLEAEKNLNRFRSQAKFRLARQSLEHWRVKEAEAAVREAIALVSDQPQYYRLLAMCLLEQGELSEATQACEMAESFGDRGSELAYMRGMIAQRTGREEKALKFYRSAMQNDETNADYVVAVAELLVALGRTDEAMNLLNDRIVAMDLNAKLLLQRAHLSVLLGNDAQAVRDFAGADKLVKATSWHSEQYGLALMRLGHYEEASRILEPLLKTNQSVDGEDLPVSRSVFLAHASCVLHSGDAQRAENLLRRHLVASTRDADAWRLLGQTRLKRKDFAGAIIAARSGAASAPRRPDWALIEAYAFWRRGEPALASNALNGILESWPRHIEALCLLGEIRAASGDQESARELFHRALAVDPSCDWARARVDASSSLSSINTAGS